MHLSAEYFFCIIHCNIHWKRAYFTSIKNNFCQCDEMCLKWCGGCGNEVNFSDYTVLWVWLGRPSLLSNRQCPLQWVANSKKRTRVQLGEFGSPSIRTKGPLYFSSNISCCVVATFFFLLIREFPFKLAEQNFTSCCCCEGFADFLAGAFFLGAAFGWGFEGSLTIVGFAEFSLVGGLEDFGVALLVENASSLLGSVLTFFSSFSPEILDFNALIKIVSVIGNEICLNWVYISFL